MSTDQRRLSMVVVEIADDPVGLRTIERPGLAGGAGDGDFQNDLRASVDFGIA